MSPRTLNKNKKLDKMLVKAEDASLTTQEHEYFMELTTNPKYSLDPDPTGELKFDKTKKDFVKAYVDYKSIAMATEIAGIPKEQSLTYFNQYDVQKEIRRINLALYHRQFSTKILNLDQIGGYLTSLIIDQNVPLADQLKTSEKLNVVNMLLKINEMKANAFTNPNELMNADLNIQIKNLSVEAIKSLLSESKKQSKEQIIDVINEDDVLTPEEKTYLNSLPTEDLLQLVNEQRKAKNKKESKL